MNYMYSIQSHSKMNQTEDEEFHRNPSNAHPNLFVKTVWFWGFISLCHLPVLIPAEGRNNI